MALFAENPDADRVLLNISKNAFHRGGADKKWNVPFHSFDLQVDSARDALLIS